MSASRKWFSSNSMLRIIQICFCLSTTWTFVQSEFYKVSSINSLRLQENRQGATELSLTGATFLFIKRHDEKSYTAQLEQTYISTTRFVPDIEVSACPEFKPIATALRKPFKVFLDDNANFKSMKFSKSDIDLSMAMKFVIATLLQANKQKLDAGKVPFDDQMVSAHGKCTVNYMRSSKAGEQSYDNVLRQLKPQTCSDLAAAKDDKQFVSSICRPRSEDKGYTFADFVRMEKVDFKSQEYSRVQGTSRLWCTPNKHNDYFFSGSFSPMFDLNPSRLGQALEKQKGSSRDPEPFNDADSKEVTELPYINIDRDMIQGESYNSAVKMYKALACYPDKKNTFMAILRIAAKCRPQKGK